MCNTVQDDLLARENFGDLPQDKHLANFILANLQASLNYYS